MVVRETVNEEDLAGKAARTGTIFSVRRCWIQSHISSGKTRSPRPGISLSDAVIGDAIASNDDVTILPLP
jgi:hypothetical protein